MMPHHHHLLLRLPPSFDPFGDLPEVETDSPESPPTPTPASPFESSPNAKVEENPGPINPFSEPVTPPAPALDPFDNLPPPAFDPFATPAVQGEQSPEEEDVPLGDVFGAPPATDNQEENEPTIPDAPPPPPAFDPFEN